MQLSQESLSHALGRIEDFWRVHYESGEDHDEILEAVNTLLASFGLDEDRKEELRKGMEKLGGSNEEGAILLGMLVVLFVTEYEQ